MKHFLIIFIAFFLFPVSAYAVNDFTGDPDVVSYWYFEEASGVRYDETANNNDFGARNTPTQESTHKEGTYSVGFLESDIDALEIADANLSADFPLKGGTSNTVFTISFWLYPLSFVEASQAFLSKFDDGQGERSLLFWSNTDKDLNVHYGYNSGGNGAALYASPSNTLAANTWYHITLTWDGADYWELFLWDDTAGSYILDTDCLDSNCGTASNTISPDTGDFFVGAREYNGVMNSTTATSSYVDELVVFKRAISPSEATNIKDGSFSFSSTRRIMFIQ